eukprot:5726934-Prymnesium_polylepis.1
MRLKPGHFRLLPPRGAFPFTAVHDSKAGENLAGPDACLFASSTTHDSIPRGRGDSRPSAIAHRLRPQHAMRTSPPRSTHRLGLGSGSPRGGVRV